MSPVETTRLIQANETLPCGHCGRIGGEPREWTDEDPAVGYRATEHGCSLCTPAARPVAMPDVRPGDLIYIGCSALPTLGFVVEVDSTGPHFCAIRTDSHFKPLDFQVKTSLPWDYLRDEGAMFLRVAKRAPAIVTDDEQDVEF